MIELNITGIREIEQRFVQLENKLRRTIARDAARAGAKPIHQTARANIRGMATKDNGESQMRDRMYKALGIRAWKAKYKGQYGLSVRFLAEKDDLKRKKRIGVGAFSGYTYGSASSLKTKEFLKSSGSRYYIPAAIEYGHAFPGRGGPGAPKDVPAKPFLRPAMESQKETVERVMRYVLVEGIERAAIGS